MKHPADDFMFVMFGERRQGVRNKFYQQLNNNANSVLNWSVSIFVVTVIFWSVV